MLDFKKQISLIGGWLTKTEGEYLYSIGKSIPETGKVVEIGSWKGRSTICLALGAKAGKKPKLYAIDPHTGSSEHKKKFGKVNTYQQFRDNLKDAKVADRVIIIKATSQAASSKIKTQVDFVLVDGAHEYSHVRQDFSLWFPKLKVGGKMAFHDCWHKPGVQLFTSQILINSREIKNPQLLDTLTIIEKTQVNSYADRIKNIAFVIYRLLIGWVGTLKINYAGGTVIDMS
jgi:predicted O-methyltransferase YrrM